MTPVSEHEGQAALLDGRGLASRIEADISAEVETFVDVCGRRPRLVVVLVGDVAASASYVKSKQQAAARVGIDSEVVRVDEGVATAELVELVPRPRGGWLSSGDRGRPLSGSAEFRGPHRRWCAADVD